LLAWVMSLQWSLWSVRSRFGAFVSVGKISFSRQQRFWFEETRFDCVIIEQEVRAFMSSKGAISSLVFSVQAVSGHYKNGNKRL